MYIDMIYILLYIYIHIHIDIHTHIIVGRYLEEESYA